MEGYDSGSFDDENNLSLHGKKRNKYLIFFLGNEYYGVPLNKVKEVIGLIEITPVPHVPNFFKGLINLRGRVISIIDLREKLNVEKREYQAKKTSIIIVEIDDTVIGAIVDDVEEVVGFEKSQIEELLDIQIVISRKFITGVAKIKGRKLIILLDITKVLSLDELSIITNESVNVCKKLQSKEESKET